jgi:hypothetical protein
MLPLLYYFAAAVTTAVKVTTQRNVEPNHFHLWLGFRI